MGLEWRPIPNYPDFEISTDGEIRDIKKGKLRKPCVVSTGYTNVGLYNSDGRKTFLVHRLMAMVFFPKYYNNKNFVVNHKDLDKTNNKLSNLEMVSQKENILHSKINGRQKRVKGKNNKLSKVVYQYDINRKFIRKWDCVMDIERELGIKSNSVSNSALHNNSVAKGYIWSYVRLEDGGDDLSD